MTVNSYLMSMSILVGAGISNEFVCCNSENIKIEVRINWRNKSEHKILLKRPNEINQGNDCTWFKQRKDLNLI